ncbi:MAG: HD domain-containing protein [Candidatus Melainabacteria bacterium]|nr:HD domain-containing protein [Candidatus Melainabacteria bacterium]
MAGNKTYKQRTYLDPIHGPIELNLNDSTDKLLAKIIDSKEFQRLRRIKQMGLGWFTFHGAEHTRFGHSLGTLYIARQMLNHLSKSFPEIHSHKKEILISALLHDIGHGPFSHTSEKFTKFNHEDWTEKIVLSNSEVNSILKKHGKNLPRKITKLLRHKETKTYLSQIISSYIDCDRLDYLLRDSYYVGVPYGLTGSDRIISSLEVDKDKIVINESIGLDAVIHYLHARYSMYKQVYQHKKNLACDFLLKKIIQRACRRGKVTSPLRDWLNIDNLPIEKINIDSFIEIDDYLLISSIQKWSEGNSGDKILSTLSNSFITRKLFKSLEFRRKVSKERKNEILEKVKKIAKAKNFDPNYYVGIEHSASTPYEPYKALSKTTDKAIFIKQKNGKVKELSQVSGLVKALSQENVVKTCLIFAPELEDDINQIKEFRELFK